MERMPEVEKLVETMVDGIRRGDVEAVLEAVSPNVTLVGGTDEGEWWRGDAAAPAIRAQLEASGGIDITAASPRAFGDGSFSVFEDLPIMKTPDGLSFPTRLTGAARLEDGRWRILQLHLSLGTPNEEIGLEDLPV